ncbi:hypothetical protein THRCLA_00663 [Thraustotheca clavata]|uniref:HIT-type domain-containing protein n=1 Tax=Thraustotheca clavata TaxID=74557 RepID=A0A1W0ABE4_9STRA|nr:hypothetical protein THRCLA_00663 [Thraustotheca clavata]
MSRQENCGVCQENKSKYKCPRCLLRYCSLGCYKKHTETPCTKEEKRKGEEKQVENDVKKRKLVEMNKEESSGNGIQGKETSENATKMIENEMNGDDSMKIEDATMMIKKERKEDAIVVIEKELNEDATVVIEKDLVKEKFENDREMMEKNEAREKSEIDKEMMEREDGEVVGDDDEMKDENGQEKMVEGDDGGEIVVELKGKVPMEVVEEDDDVPLLTKAQLDVIAMSSLVRASLENPNIRQKIKEIDGHENRLHELQKALTDPTFAQFVYGMMDQVTQVKP